MLLVLAIFQNDQAFAAEIPVFGDREFQLSVKHGTVTFRIPSKFIVEIPEIHNGEITRIRTCLSFPDGAACYGEKIDPVDRIILVLLSSPPMDHEFFSQDLSRSWRDQQPASEIYGLKIVSIDYPEYFADKKAYFKEKDQGGFIVITCYGENDTFVGFCFLSTKLGEYGVRYSFSRRYLPDWEDIYDFVLKHLKGWQF